MTATIYLLFFTTFSVMLELILRSFGLYLPLAALFLFYAAIVFGYRAGAAAAAHSWRTLPVIWVSTLFSALGVSCSSRVSI